MSAIESITGLEGGNCSVTCKSIWDGKLYTREIPVDFLELVDYATNPAGLIQDVFPELNDDDREFLISGITPDQWSKVLGEEE